MNTIESLAQQSKHLLLITAAVSLVFSIIGGTLSWGVAMAGEIEKIKATQERQIEQADAIQSLNKELDAVGEEIDGMGKELYKQGKELGEVKGGVDEILKLMQGQAPN